jgi:PLP dependent protein
MMDSAEWDYIPGRLAEIRDRIRTAALRVGRDEKSIRLVLISKNSPPEAVMAAYEAGHREFGENRVQIALPKIDALPGDVLWHLVGHLQSNKVNKVLGRFDLIHSLDSRELAERLSEKSLSREIVSSVLVEVNCSGDSSKQGLAMDQALEFTRSLADLKGIIVDGLMTIGPLGGGAEGARQAFRDLREIYDVLRSEDHPSLPLRELSMGMTDDFEIAVEEGATLLRVGRAVFSA